MVAALSSRARASVKLLFASASIAITRFPAFAKASAVKRADVVFPTPPFSDAKAIPSRLACVPREVLLRCCDQ